MTRLPRWISPLDCLEAIRPKASFQFPSFIYKNWKLKTDRWLLSLSQAEPCHACPRCPAISYSLQLSYKSMKIRNIIRDRFAMTPRTPVTPITRNLGNWDGWDGWDGSGDRGRCPGARASHEFNSAMKRKRSWVARKTIQ